MRAILFPRKDEVKALDLPDPVAGANDVIVRVRASGICHTDLEVLKGNYGSSAFPLVPGHEFSGVIAEVGAGVTELRSGDAVVVDPNLECGTCDACERGYAHLCERLGAYGVTVNGGFAEYCMVKASAVHPIHDLPFHLAALAEPMGCVLNGVEAADGANARSALIFGAGSMGHLMAIALRIRGVPEISLVDIDDARLELTESFGFSPVRAGSEALERMRQSFDLVVDATGVAAVAERLIEYTASGGTCHFFGVCPSEARIKIAPFEVFRRQLKLVGSHSLNHNIPEALAVIRAFGLDMGRLVSHRLPLDEIVGMLNHGAPKGSLKIQAHAPPTAV